VLATGGTIAGSGASSTTTVGYTAATVPVETLLNSVPETKKVANVSDEQVFQIASENMTDDHWLKLARRMNELLTQDHVDWHRHHPWHRHHRGDGLLPQPGGKSASRRWSSAP